jgi:hypothetical protein
MARRTHKRLNHCWTQAGGDVHRLAPDGDGVACEPAPRPGEVMRWGMGDPAVHDEVVISAALVSVSDELPWAVEVPDQVVAAGDHLTRLGRGRRGW